MCTVSWARTTQGYEVFFSRDEKRSRPEGAPPRIWKNESRHWMAPLDPQGGGTWIFINDVKLAACVMNASEAEPKDTQNPSSASRGQLLLKLVGAKTLDDVHRHLEQAIKMEHYRPGFILAWDPLGHARCWQWESDQLEPLGEPARPMVTTSSYLPQQVIEARRDAFHRFCGSSGHTPPPEKLLRFHLAPDQAPSALTVRMSRPDARTVSLTHVRVGTRVARMSYAPRHNDADFERVSETELEWEGEPAYEIRLA